MSEEKYAAAANNSPISSFDTGPVDEHLEEQESVRKTHLVTGLERGLEGKENEDWSLPDFA